MNRSKLILAAALLPLAGCASSTGPGVAQLPVEAVVVNQSGQGITGISYQPCDSGGDTWSRLDVPSLRSGQMTTFQLPAACVNLRAYYADGRVAGSQVGIRRDFPFKWTIS